MGMLNKKVNDRPSIAEGWPVWLLLVLPLILWLLIMPGFQNGEFQEDRDSNNSGDDPCDGYKTCGSCTFSRFQYFASEAGGLRQRSSCHWCGLSSTCYSPSQQPKDFCTNLHTNQSEGIHYQYDCPLGPIPYPDHPPELLPNWMGEFHQAGILDHVRLIDLSLPGTHDSLSYDLSLTVSADGLDGFHELAKLLHSLSGGLVKMLPGDLEEFFRMQAKTQQLSLTQQLDNGVRFLDFRIMWEPDQNAWYSIHMMQSKKPAEAYLWEIRQWLDAHPQEVVVIWLSKHGSTTDTGDSQYPGVSKEQKQQFWSRYCAIFDGLLQDTNQTSIFHTPLRAMIEKNHRVISYVSDYVDFTQNSTLAENAAFIQNAWDNGDGVFKEESRIQNHIDYFKNASVNNAITNKAHGFTLLAMNTASPPWQVIAAAKHQFLHWQKMDSGKSQHKPQIKHALGFMLTADALWQVVSDFASQWLDWIEKSTKRKQKKAARLQATLFSSCTSHIKIPGVDHWCPSNLMDIAQLSSYYNQIVIEEAYNHCFNDHGNSTRIQTAFPNAFYLDSFDYDGTIRVGPQLLDGSERGDMNHNVQTKDSKYALVDTLLAYNARVACASKTSDSEGCKSLLDRINERRAVNPLKRWNEPDLGRHSDWPPYSYEAPYLQ